LKRKFGISIIIVVFLFFLCSCESKTKLSKNTTVVDSTGDIISLPDKIERVICVSKPATSFIVAMGSGDTIVGAHGSVTLDEWDKLMYPSFNNVKKYGYKPTSEGIYECGADLVILSDREYAKTLRNDGICAICYDPQSVEDTISCVKMLGTVFGEDAQSYSEKWLLELTNVLKECDNFNNIDNTVKSVYFLNASSDGSIYSTFGSISVINSWIESIGGKLITNNIKETTVLEANEEEILKSNPDIIVIGGFYSYKRYEELLENPLWQNMNAIKNNDVYIVPIGFTSWDRFGVEAPLFYKWGLNLLYPEKYNIDFFTETKKFYSEFYNVDLTTENVNFILKGLLPDGGKP